MSVLAQPERKPPNRDTVFQDFYMKHEGYVVRTMNRKEVDLAIEWAAREGWNPGIHDADCFYSADPKGFFIGLLGNEPIATISAIKYGKSFGFLGFYIVKPEHRGNGYGLQIWNAALKYLEGRDVGLDGVVVQQENYKRSGFKLAYRNVRRESHGGGNFPEYPDIARLSSLPFEAVNSYDRPFFPEDRTQFIRSWVNQAGCKAFGVMQNGKLAGYGVARRCRSGYKIGPLFADTVEKAEALFLALRSGINAAEPIYLDTPEINRSAVGLAERYSMKVVFETVRMYMGEAPDLPLNRIFSVTSFEVG